ncbi:MAG TPA: hypothetical protein VMY76_11765 [Gemmatimonadales bacterium]|nr:hypothetical protein [Gemmatimonadales bacterium]
MRHPSGSDVVVRTMSGCFPGCPVLDIEDGGTSFDPKWFLDVAVQVAPVRSAGVQRVEVKA